MNKHAFFWHSSCYRAQRPTRVPFLYYHPTTLRFSSPQFRVSVTFSQVGAPDPALLLQRFACALRVLRCSYFDNERSSVFKVPAESRNENKRLVEPVCCHRGPRSCCCCCLGHVLHFLLRFGCQRRESSQR